MTSKVVRYTSDCILYLGIAFDFYFFGLHACNGTVINNLKNYLQLLNFVLRHFLRKTHV